MAGPLKKKLFFAATLKIIPDPLLSLKKCLGVPGTGFMIQYTIQYTMQYTIFLLLLLSIYQGIFRYIYCLRTDGLEYFILLQLFKLFENKNLCKFFSKNIIIRNLRKNSFFFVSKFRETKFRNCFFVVNFYTVEPCSMYKLAGNII